MYSDSLSKSDNLNKQFQSVFTKKSTTATTRLFGNKYPSIGNLSITLKGVQKLLEKINISKAAGLDLIPGRMLNMLAPELAPIVHAIFTQSLDTGELPRDWSLANVAPIFKKGNRVLAENYRPFSLTCITCKLFEHIVCRHILDHVEDHNILVQKSTAYTWLDCCCFNAAQIVLTPPAPRNGGPFLPFFGQAGQVDPLVGWRSCY